jgi:geranylgeranyl diphosphate synthase type I
MRGRITAVRTPLSSTNSSLANSSSQLSQLKAYKVQLGAFLTAFLQEKAQQFNQAGPWVDDVFERLTTFSTQGKMLRGALVIHLYVLSSNHQKKAIPESVLKTAVALELAQSALLIHDDILDQDELRRGQPSMHTQYRTWAASQKLSQTDHVGQGLAICVGDIALFLATELLNQADELQQTRGQLSQLFAQEHVAVGLAEMHDFTLGLQSRVPSAEEVKQLYLHKTARYTLSVPLMMGAILAHQEPSLIATLGRCGEYLGTIFQIKDDEMGIFGDEKKTGKPVGADIREGKKTLFYLALLNMIEPALRSQVDQAFGNRQLTPAMIEWVRAQLKNSGAYEVVMGEVKRQAQLSQTLIEAEIKKNDMKIFLTELLSYLAQRSV